MELFTLFLIISFCIFFRYFFTGIGFNYFLNRYFFYLPKIVSHKVAKNQKNKEIYYAFLSSLIFAAVFINIVLLSYLEVIIIDFNNSWSKSIFSHLGSIIGFLLIHDFYYYWLHRLMHHKSFYRKIHKVHHDSIETSVWTSFSFHPFETVLQVLPFFAYIYFVPMHIYSIFFLLTLMTISAAINHINKEFYPSWFLRSRFGKYIISATHHAAHHKYFHYNFGLYFSYLDHFFDTERQ